MLCDAFIDSKCMRRPVRSLLALVYLTVCMCVCECVCLYFMCNPSPSPSAHSSLSGHSKLHVLHRLRRMGLSNELFLVLIS